jgi:hypothetical protein
MHIHAPSITAPALVTQQHTCSTWLHTHTTCTLLAGIDIEAQSPLRRRAARFLAAALPLSMAGVLAWGFYEPDEQKLFGASSPRQVAVAGESVVNWSATHTAQPRCVEQMRLCVQGRCCNRVAIALSSLVHISHSGISSSLRTCL